MFRAVSRAPSAMPKLQSLLSKCCSVENECRMCSQLVVDDFSISKNDNLVVSTSIMKQRRTDKMQLIDKKSGD